MNELASPLCIELYKIPQVAECLQVGPRTVQRLIKSGKLSAHHFPFGIRISHDQVMAFLAAHRRGAMTPATMSRAVSASRDVGKTSSE